MTSITKLADILPLHVVVRAEEGEQAWHAARAEGATASEAHRITQGGRGAWRTLLTDKLNGATFRGNSHTRRGHEREPFLLAFADEHIAMCAPNADLFGNGERPLHRATPDGVGWTPDRGGFGVEVKSHDHGWTRDDIPREHYDQMQFGMHVLGADWWLYVWEVMGEDGEPTLDEPQHLWVPRDQARIDRLTAEVDRFLSWRAAGAPEHDDLPDDIDDALAAWADARARKNAAASEEAAADKKIRLYALTAADEHGAKGAGTRAHFTLAKSTALDEAAWADAEPETYAEYLELRTRVKATEKAAAELYARETLRLTITPTKEQA